MVDKHMVGVPDVEGIDSPVLGRVEAEDIDVDSGDREADHIAVEPRRDTAVDTVDSVEVGIAMGEVGEMVDEMAGTESVVGMNEDGQEKKMQQVEAVVRHVCWLDGVGHVVDSVKPGSDDGMGWAVHGELFV